MKKINKQKVQACYDAFSKDYDQSAIDNAAVIMDHPIILNLLKKEINKKGVGLDLGCGTGILTLKTASFVKKIIGLDISPKMIKIAKSKLEPSKLNVRFKQFDITQKIPFKNNCFDFIISSLVVCHIENVKNLYKEVYRVLKPNGIFIFDDLTSNLNKPFHLKHRDYLSEFSADQSKLWEKRKIKNHIQTLKNIGFKIEAIIKTKIDKHIINVLTPEDYKANFGCQFTTIIKARKLL